MMLPPFKDIDPADRHRRTLPDGRVIDTSNVSIINRKDGTVERFSWREWDLHEARRCLALSIAYRKSGDRARAALFLRYANRHRRQAARRGVKATAP